MSPKEVIQAPPKKNEKTESSKRDIEPSQTKSKKSKASAFKLFNSPKKYKK
jgi:hypothetical protein